MNSNERYRPLIYESSCCQLLLRSNPSCLYLPSPHPLSPEHHSKLALHSTHLTYFPLMKLTAIDSHLGFWFIEIQCRPVLSHCLFSDRKIRFFFLYKSFFSVHQNTYHHQPVIHFHQLWEQKHKSGQKWSQDTNKIEHKVWYVAPHSTTLAKHLVAGRLNKNNIN